MALCDDSIWVATTDSSVDRLPAEGRKMLKNGASFLAGSLSFTRSRASSEGSAPVSCAICLNFGLYSRQIMARLDE